MMGMTRWTSRSERAGTDDIPPWRKQFLVPPNLEMTCVK